MCFWHHAEMCSKKRHVFVWSGERSRSLVLCWGGFSEARIFLARANKIAKQQSKPCWIVIVRVMRMSFLVIYDLCIQSLWLLKNLMATSSSPKKKCKQKEHQNITNSQQAIVFSFDSWGDQLDLFGSLEARGFQSCRTYCTRGVEHVPGGGMDGCKWMIRDELRCDWVNLVNVTELCKLDWDVLKEFLIVFVDGEFKWLLHLGYFWSLPAKLHEYCWQAAAEHQDANHRAGQALAELLVRTLRLQGKYLLLGGRGYYPVLSKKWPQTLRGRVFFTNPRETSIV